MQTLTVGQAAPHFTLQDQRGQSVELQALLANHRVLIFLS